MFGENEYGESFYDAADDEDERTSFLDQAFYTTFLGHQYDGFNEEGINEHNKMMEDMEEFSKKKDQKDEVIEIEHLHSTIVKMEDLKRQGYFESRRTNFEEESDLTKQSFELQFVSCLFCNWRQRPSLNYLNLLVHDLFNLGC